MSMKTRFQLKETVVTIISDAPYVETIRQAIVEHRRQLEQYITFDPFFRVTMEPYPLPEDGPEIVKRLILAGNAVGVGPMAAVAGSIAELAVEAALDKGAKHVVVDNGGDIALFTDRPVLVGIYAGESAVKNLTFQMEAQESIIGICTSSGKIGHSISFGNTDAATVVSKSASLADATATALGNAVLDDSKKDIEKAFDVIDGVDDIEGALIIKGDHIGLWGKLPKMVKVPVNPDFITRP